LIHEIKVSFSKSPRVTEPELGDDDPEAAEETFSLRLQVCEDDQLRPIQWKKDDVKPVS
jgi:hypothetical protein